MSRKAKPSADAKREAALAEAQRLATLLSTAPAQGGDLLAPPAFVADPRLAPALAVWKDLAPTLASTGRLAHLDRSTFAALCYWHAEYITAIDDILERGYSFMVKATSGGVRPWTNPSVERRDTAWTEIMKLSERFGLTPLDRIALNKNRGMIRDDGDELPLVMPVAATSDGEDVKPDKWIGLLPN